MNQEEIIKYYSESIENYKGKVIGLIGDLGAGKTHFVKEVLSKVSTTFDEQVNSPTYNLCNIYEGSGVEVHHFDLYRIESEEELYHINLWESIENPLNIIFIEWVNFFKEIENQCDEIIEITFKEDGERFYNIKKQ